MLKSVQIDKLEAMVEEKGLEMSWKAERRAEFKRVNESKRELEALTENSKVREGCVSRLALIVCS